MKKTVWNKGKKMSKEFREKISRSLVGNKYKLGKKHTEEFKIAVSKRMKGHKYNLGRKLSEEHKRKLSVLQKGKKRSLQTKINISNSLKGNKHPNWKGGITKENSRLRNSYKYKEWRMKVYIRDHFTCQICNQVGKKLQAHHIKSFASFPELRFILENGITLCQECHKLTDNYKNKKQK